GRAGSGFTGQMLKDVGDQLVRLEIPRPAFDGPVPAEKASHWVKPELVAEVRYKEVTGDGLLRQPVFLRFRDDKRPEECVIPGNGKRETGNESDPTSPVSPFPFPEERREVRFSNLEKIFWPDERYTKGDLIEYYRAVSPWMLRYLAERPLVLTRYPDGINVKSFFHKDVPTYSQAFVRTVTTCSKDAHGALDHSAWHNEAALHYIAN